jgi:hypothetical protein
MGTGGGLSSKSLSAVDFASKFILLIFKFYTMIVMNLDTKSTTEKDFELKS